MPTICMWSSSDASERKLHDEELRVEHAEIVAPVHRSGRAAGYLIIWNGTDQSKSLSSIRLPSGNSIALHETVVVGGIARMRPVDFPYTIPPRSELVMRRGSYHMMFPAADVTLVPHEQMKLRLEFSGGQSMEVKAIVRPFGTPVAGDHHGESGS